jgi:hypothetical protein
MMASNSSRERKPFSVTIGPEFGKIGKSEPLSKDLESQITRLTGAAEQYLQRGQSALAFDSLMEAYLLDPLNPRVVSCEKNVLPAWEAFRNKQSSVPASVAPMTDEQRLSRLKAEREVVRQAKERKVWEQASRTTGVSSQKLGTPQAKPGKQNL